VSDIFKSLEIDAVFSAIKRAAKWQHDSYYWKHDTEWKWIKDELYKSDNKIEQLEQENAKLKERLKDAESVIKFYATPSVWGISSPSDMTSIDPCDVGDFFHQEIGVTSRGGKRAREYFKK